jgi:5-methylcytosine-specific restriction endonuclease McrA
MKASRKVGSKNWEKSLHIDHLIPISKGGSDTLENVRPTHALCNLKKGNRND